MTPERANMAFSSASRTFSRFAWVLRVDFQPVKTRLV